MSELKAKHVVDVYDEYSANPTNEAQVYLKSEADAVIEELKADYREACGRLQTANLIKDEQLAATRHLKFKRCIDKANYWVAVSYQCVDDKHRQSAERHHRKWIELAGKFEKWR